MKYTALIVAGVLSLPALGTAEEETLKEKTQEAGRAVKDAAVKTGEALERAGEKVVKETKEVMEEAKELFTEEEANKVPVKIENHQIGMATTVDAGKTRFVVTNAGTTEHSFEIQGRDMTKRFWISIAPGATKNLDVDLKPGAYTAVCPLEGHADKGVKLMFAVK